MKELLEKIPPEKRWDITAKTLWRFTVLRGDKIIAPLLGIGKDIISPLWSKEKWYEINEKIWTEGGKMLIQFVTETFNISVEDAIGAATLSHVVGKFVMGPEWEIEIGEATPERAVVRYTNCPNWEIYNEFEVNPEFRPCDVSHELFVGEGLKALNPKLTYKLTKAMGWGDPYCECVIEFKDEQILELLTN